jgi:hypothetical protein
MNEPLAICNLTLILVTGLVSWLGFISREVEEKYIFDPERILAGKEFYRLITAALQPWTLRANLQVFLIVLSAAVLLLLYLWFNPLLLSTAAFFSRPSRSRDRLAHLPKHKRESLQLDAILEKIARSGMDSLTLQEKSLLEQLSAKYKSREESKKPESGLAI